MFASFTKLKNSPLPSSSQMEDPSQRSLRVRLLLDNSTRSYFAGQSITGRVVIVTTVPKKISAISIQFEGKAQACWKKTVWRYKQRCRVDQTEEQLFVKNVLPLDNDNPSEFRAGSYFYPFQFSLPSQAPSSFVCRTAQVSYILKVVVQPTGENFRVTTFPITVIGQVDISATATSVRLVKRPNILLHKEGLLEVFFRLPRGSVFAKGETIEVLVDVRNGSDCKVTSLKLSFRQRLTFHAKGESREEEKVLSKVEGPLVDPGDTLSWTLGSAFKVPDVPQTYLGGICGLIQVAYCVRLKVDTGLMSSSMESRLPIVIRSEAPQTLRATAEGSLRTRDLERNQETTSSNLFSSPPPSYEEATAEYCPPLTIRKPKKLD